MTRKRFVKLLMAEGYSRNGANEIAEEVLADGFTYAEGYDHVTRMLPLVKAMVDTFADAVKKATDAITRIAVAAAEAAKAFVDAFHAAMAQT